MTVQNWVEKTIGDFCPFTYGKGLPARDRISHGDIPVYGSNGIVGSHIEPLTSGPTVIVGRKGTIGSVHYSSEPCWPIDTTFYLTDVDPLRLRYKYYLLKALRLDQMNADSAVPGLNRGDAHSRVFQLPPLDEQRRIAYILGTLDDKIELNRRMSQTLEAMAQALFKSWFVDFDPVQAKAEGRPTNLPPEIDALFPDSFQDSELGKLPSGWEVATLGDICDKPQYGYTQSAQTEPVGPKFLRITDINKQPWIEWESVPHCEITPDDIKKYRLHHGDILIARMADPGHGCMVEGNPDAVFASYLIRFRPKQERYARYLQYWLRSEGFWDLVRGRRTGTTRANLNAKALSGFPLVMPPALVLEEFATQVGGLRTRVVANVAESRGLSVQRDTVLRSLISVPSYGGASPAGEFS